MEVALQPGVFIMIKFILFFISIIFCTALYSEEKQTITEKNKSAGLSFYKPSYFLIFPKPFKFQFSVKYRLIVPTNTSITDGTGVFAAYTQKSRWQVHGLKNDASYIESNYSPEIFYIYDLDKQHLLFKTLQLGLVHESNGLGKELRPLHRGWNRLYLAPTVGLPNEALSATLRTWIIFGKPDNPDISKFLGLGDLILSTKILKNYYQPNIELTIKKGTRGLVKNVSYQFDHTIGPLTIKYLGIMSPLNFYTQLYYGYGDMLEDYNRKTKRIRVGVRCDY